MVLLKFTEVFNLTHFCLIFMKFVKSHLIICNWQSTGQDISLVNYNVHYALRLCQEAGLTEASVQLSALLGLWTMAVDLALTISVDLAKQIASMPSHNGDDELKKKLWLKIGRIINNFYKIPDTENS